MMKRRILSIILIIVLVMNGTLAFATTPTEADSKGYIKGLADGESKAKQNLNIGNLESAPSAMPSKEVILLSYSGIYRDEYLAGYERGFTEAYEEEINAETTYAQRLGNALGSVRGAKDYKDNKTSDWSQAIPTREEIIDMYRLNVETPAYRENFILEFSIEFEKAYNLAFERANLEPDYSSSEAGKRDGTALGNSLGAVYGKIDFDEDRSSLFTRHLPSDATIISDYSLYNDNADYRNAFIINFKLAFELSYNEAYRKANMEDPRTEASSEGYELGYVDGKAIAESNKSKNILQPFNMVKLSNEEVRQKYASLLVAKSEAYITEFVLGYQEGFKEGYDNVFANDSVFQDGYSKGYAYGKSLADKSNSDKTYIPFEKVVMDRNRAITVNYDYLKDKSNDFIITFIDGFLDGFEEGYRDTILTGEVDEIEPPTISAGFGTSLGLLYGEMAGIEDYENGKSPNWSRAMPSSSEINRMFDLRNLPTADREEFLEQFEINFQKGYENAYYNAHFGIIRDSLDAGKADGTTFGTMIGKLYGMKDFYENSDLDYTRDMPRDTIIIAEYSLRKDSTEYQQGFLNSFKNAYRESYIESYRNAKNSSIQNTEGNALANGKAVGITKGEIQASLDFMQKLSNDWKRSLPSEQYIALEYDLNLQTPNYRNQFISGFYDGYMEAYNRIYQELAQGAGLGKTVSTSIPLAGGLVLSADNAFAIKIDAGTYYHPVQLSINTNYDVGNKVVSSLVKASDSYRVSVLNTSGNLNNSKPIEIAFEYYGDRLKGGIYKLSNGFWTYVPSVVNVEDNSIVAKIAPSTISATGNVYAVFVDTSAKYFADSRGHWAKDEIETLVRRNIIYGYPDGTFKPDRNVTRAEFLWLLSRMNRWNLPYYPVNERLFTDFNTFGTSAEVINYAFAEGYIKGYPDGTFRPNNNITYTEIQTIMGRVTGKYDFKWEDISKKMLYDEKVRSASYTDMNNKITRAEVVYMLYNLTESMY